VDQDGRESGRSEALTVENARGSVGDWEYRKYGRSQWRRTSQPNVKLGYGDGLLYPWDGVSALPNHLGAVSAAHILEGCPAAAITARSTPALPEL
jgi:hypothetical protein